MLRPLVLLSFLALWPSSLPASCRDQAFSCPLDLQFSKEAQEMAETSQKKVEDILESPEFKAFRADLATPSKPLTSAQEKPIFYVFVSFSMGEKALLNLANDAKDYGAVLVLRGFYGDSFRQTVQILHKIIQETNQGFLIDPELFERFHIKAAPTLILSSPKKETHDQLQGHVSLHHALETFVKDGDLKEDAQALLNYRRQP